LHGLAIAGSGCLIFAGSEPLVNRSIIEWNPKLRTPKISGNLQTVAWSVQACGKMNNDTVPAKETP
jgi:hypothetical protein